MTRRCDRYRVFAALQSDGELSAFELALLRDHARSCPSCRVRADEIEAITAAIRRSAPQLPLRRIVVEGGRLARSHAARLHAMQAAAMAALMFLAIPSDLPAPTALQARGTQAVPSRSRPLDDDRRLLWLVSKPFRTGEVQVS